MSDGAGFLVVVGAIIGLVLVIALWLDVQARRRGSKLATGAAMTQAMRDAKRDARASRSRLHMGSGRVRPPSTTRPSGRPSWDDRKG